MELKIDHESLVQEVAMRVLRISHDDGSSVLDAIRQEVRGQLAVLVDAEAKAIIRERLTEEVNRMLEEGWSEVTPWGERKPATTYRQMLASAVQAFVTKRMSGGFADRNSKGLQEVVFEHAQAFIRKDLEAASKDAVRKFRDEVDGVILAKFGESLRKALGMN